MRITALEQKSIRIIQLIQTSKSIAEKITLKQLTWEITYKLDTRADCRIIGMLEV